MSIGSPFCGDVVAWFDRLAPPLWRGLMALRGRHVNSSADVNNDRLGKILIVARIIVVSQLALFVCATIWAIATPKLNAGPPPNANWSLTNLALLLAIITPAATARVRRTCEWCASRRITRNRKRYDSEPAVSRRELAYLFLYEGYLIRVCAVQAVLIGQAYFLLVAFAYEKQIAALIGAIGLVACAMVDLTSARQIRRWCREKLRYARSAAP